MQQQFLKSKAERKADFEAHLARMREFTGDADPEVMACGGGVEPVQAGASVVLLYTHRSFVLPERMSARKVEAQVCPQRELAFVSGGFARAARTTNHSRL